MKIKISAQDISQIFEYLDENKEGYLSYHKFCGLCEEKRRNIDPFDRQAALQQINKNFETQFTQEQKTIEDLEQDKLERLSVASQLYKGFKSNKLKNGKSIPKVLNANHSFGIGTLPSDNMGKIMTHDFEREFV